MWIDKTVVDVVTYLFVYVMGVITPFVFVAIMEKRKE